MDKPPYDPEALPPDLRSLIPQNYRRPTSISSKICSNISPNSHPSPKQTFVVTPQRPAKPYFKKSYAQVESLVSPPNSCGLKPRRRKRRNPLTVRLSDNDREHIRAKAKTAGCSLNAYVRASVLGSDYQPPKDPELAQALLKLNFELTKQGVNFNQIARQLNAGVISPAQAETMIAIIARSTLQIHKAIRQAMAKGKPEE